MKSLRKSIDLVIHCKCMGEKLDKCHCSIAALFLVAEPDEWRPRFSVDVVHAFDLERTLNNISLVDTKRINPDLPSLLDIWLVAQDA